MESGLKVSCDLIMAASIGVTESSVARGSSASIAERSRRSGSVEIDQLEGPLGVQRSEPRQLIAAG